MALKKERDPFSYFGIDLNDSDISSSDEDHDGGEKTIKADLSFISKSDSSSEKDKVLPKADDVFQTVKKPEFLNKSSQDVNWDRLLKNEINKEEEPEMRTNEMPPPKFYEPSTKPIKPTLGDPDEESSTLKRPIEDEPTENKKVKS